MQLPLVSTFTRAFMAMLVAVLLPRRMREGRCTPGGDPSWPGGTGISHSTAMWVATERGMAAEDPKLSLCPERPRSNGRYADTRNPMQSSSWPTLVCSPGPLLSPSSPWRIFPDSRGGSAETRGTSSGYYEMSIESTAAGYHASWSGYSDGDAELTPTVPMYPAYSPKGLSRSRRRK